MLPSPERPTVAEVACHCLVRGNAQREAFCRKLCWTVVAALVMAASAKAASPQREPVSQYLSQLQAAEQLAARCDADAGACKIDDVPAAATVAGSPAGEFRADWAWLVEAIHATQEAAKESTAAKSGAIRHQAMDAALRRLRQLRAESTGQAVTGAEQFGRARQIADRTLSRPEFRSVDGPSWWARQVAHLQNWISRLFLGLNQLGYAAPWLAPLLEWGLFALALAGLLWFVRQSLARQSLRIAFAEGAPLGSVRGRDREEWARMADEHAGRGEYRDAMHCLYWAAVAGMEGRRAWKPNPTRTPREYLHLLQPGSEGQRLLRSLTVALERAWYAQEPVSEQELLRARSELAALDRARLERTGSDGSSLSRAGVRMAGEVA